MSPREEKRPNRPVRGSGASRDGKKFEKRSSASSSSETPRRGGPGKFDKPSFSEYKGKPREEDGSSRPYKSFDKNSSSNFKSSRPDSRDSRDSRTTNKSDFNPRFRSKPQDGDSRDTRFSDDSDFKPRLVKKPLEDSPRPSKIFLKNESLRSFKETRFDDGKKMRPRLKNKTGEDTPYDPSAKYSKKKQLEHQKKFAPTGPSRLNKYIANAGLCSRREADEYIKAGVVTVNGIVVTEMGAKVMPDDKVLFHDQLVRSEKKIYVLLNKPKDCVTTTDDPKARLTVMDLVKNACNERIYPVGRLDRNTTGVLLITNDGDLASKLMHPKFEKKKIYHAFLDKALTKTDFNKIAEGIELEDGPIKADSINYVEDDDKKQIGIEIHSGRNRVVRRIFEKLGYKVVRLDRVFFAGLTKKNLSRGQWRHLSEKEINMLRMGAFE